MPRIENVEKHNDGHFGFSAVRMEDLLAASYTLVTVAMDVSGSTAHFQSDLQKYMETIVDACKKSPHKDNLLLRFVTFSNSHQEIHGFKMLSSIQSGEYNGRVRCGGTTALYDASVDALEAMNNYGRKLVEENYEVNGIVFIITDGIDNSSRLSATDVKKALDSAVSGENMESMVSVLIELGSASVLGAFNQQVGFDAHEKIGSATPDKLAKLAQFTSQSVSSQSQALGTGQPSQVLSF